MIYTITFNPALDYIVRLDHLTTGTINRTEQEYVLGGGKGINVSIVLNNLGMDRRHSVLSLALQVMKLCVSSMNLAFVKALSALERV